MPGFGESRKAPCGGSTEICLVSYAWPHAAETASASDVARAVAFPSAHACTAHHGRAQGRPLVLVRVQPPQDRARRAAALARHPPARASQADLRLDDLRGRRLDAG